MPKLTIIDGNSLLFRSYYATAYPGMEIMRTTSGIPTNAIFAFSNMMNKIINGLKEGEGIIVAFDAAKHNFRHDALETYKANRKPAPTELVEQFPIVREFLRSFGVFQFEEEGFEGDDIAGSIARKAEQEGYEVEIYTSDRDFLQLVSDKVSVQIIRKGLSDVVKMTPEVVKETFGFEPKQIIDYKGLRGDSSDNLPGIPGIGEKTAVKLIEEYGSFDNIISHASEIKGKVGEMITANADKGIISRDLAIIKTDIDLPFSVDDTTYHGYSFKAVNEFCQKYEFKQFLSKISPKWKQVNEDTAAIEVETISSIKGINLGKEFGVALDYEDDEDYFNSEVFGIALSNKSKHYYINIDDAVNDKELLDLISNKDIKKYCYDYKAIKVALSKRGVNIEGLEFDLLIATYLIDTTVKGKIEPVLNVYGVDISENKEEVSLFSNENPDRTAKIAYFSYVLAGKVRAELVKINALELFEHLELPLVNILAKMEIEGFPIDVTVLDGFGDEWKARLKELEQEIYELAGEEFNISSPKQLGEILFNKLGLPANKKGSTSAGNLSDLAKYHPIIPKIMEYRKYAKLISTYVEGLKNHIYKDKKIHATFNQALTQTGRLSSSNPNLQNISVRDEEGKLIRKAFYYPEDEYEILSLDYSQIELRILAHLSNCPNLKNIFMDPDSDIHTATAKKIFKLDGEPTALQRRKAKAVNFGIIYGISDWGLADQLEISVKESKEIISSFYETFPEVNDFFKNIVDNALKDSYVSTMMGRRRYLRELHDSNYQVREFAKRAAMNAPIQGSAADLIKVAMIEVDKALTEGKFKTKLVLQIHDELIFKVPKEEKETVYNVIRDRMIHALDLSIPLEVDGGFGKSWYDCK